MRLTRADWVRLLLLWLGGIDVRLTMLAVPPLIPLIHRELHLDEKAVGALVSGPVLILAIAAVPGSLLIAKLGARGALFAGLGSVALFGALRGVGPSAPVLFASTFLMGVGIAVTQPAFPALVREWFPRRIAIATAVYSNGILIGETLPTVLTTPVGVLALAHGDWRWALGSWSVAVALTAVAIAKAAPGRSSNVARPAHWWPSWRQGQAVRIGVVMGMASATYFGANAFIPDFLDQTGRHGLISPSLALLNGSQLLTAPLVALWPNILTGRAGFIASAAVMAAAQLGLVFTPGAGVMVWAFVLGFSTALAFIVVLSLPPRLAPPGEVASMSAAIFTLQYATAFVIPLIAGALWDATGHALLAFVPGIVAAAAMAWGALSLRIPGRNVVGEAESAR
ncbi:MAG TPA: MFS transporter [Candidatus Dormibacteraeota bacterium]|nr:MFS transporter [Candidatus Dormibacteraeota bacterium]